MRTSGTATPRGPLLICGLSWTALGVFITVYGFWHLIGGPAERANVVYAIAGLVIAAYGVWRLAGWTAPANGKTTGFQHTPAVQRPHEEKHEVTRDSLTLVS